MAFLKLSDVGKIYTSENNVSVGIRRVNLSFEKGEFVAVTGKSGSGKTTLLNVIGGLDSYEEGEMYIEGNSTSHYIKADWDEYVAKYISFIFQDYNILESFTVYENIEFALTSVKDLKERKRRALEIIEKVGLKDRADTKGIKLSGGEKQRTVIARAIAKDSPIILADEPTGNLDSVNAKSILALLKEVSEEKLVIVVTHNYDDVKEYATRHIRIFDGGIESDEVFEKAKTTYEAKENAEDKYEKEKLYVFKKRRKRVKVPKEHRLVAARDNFLLGWKRFRSRPKQSILISFILFIALAGIIFAVSAVSNMDIYYSRVLVNDMDGRVIVGNSEGKFGDVSAGEVAQKYGAEEYVMHDIFLDSNANLLKQGSKADEIAYLQVDFASGKKMSKGRQPQGRGEVAISLPYNLSNEYKIGDKIQLFKMSDLYFYTGNCIQSLEYEIVGLDYYVDNRIAPSVLFSKEGYDFYAGFMRLEIYSLYSINVSVDEEGNPVLTDRFGNSYKNSNMKNTVLIVDFDSQSDVVETNLKIASDEMLYVSYNSQRLIFDNVTYNADLQTINPDIYGYSHVYVKIGYQALQEFFPDQSQQISLIFKSDKAAEQAVAKMLDDKMLAIMAKNMNKTQDMSLEQKIVNFFSTTLISVAFSVTITLITVVTLIKLMALGRKDVSVFRTMGIPDSTVKASTYVQLFIAMLPALLMVVVIVMILYFAPIGIIFQYMGWNAVLMMALAMALILMILAGVYNKLIYKQKIRKGLRRANK